MTSFILKCLALALLSLGLCTAAALPAKPSADVENAAGSAGLAATESADSIVVFPGGMPPWKPENNQCKEIFKSTNPCARCNRGSYCACKYAYPGPKPKQTCFQCKTNTICPGDGQRYPNKKPPAPVSDFISYLRGQRDDTRKPPIEA